MAVRWKPAGASKRAPSRVIVAGGLVAAVLWGVWLHGCAPARTSLVRRPDSPPASPPEAILTPAVEESSEAPSVTAPRIREETLGAIPRPAPAPKSREAAPRPAPEVSSLAPSDDESLIAKITANTPPRRVASLRLTEEGKRLLEAGDYPKALARLEKTIALDATNPYGYYYLAKAHHHMGRYRESLNFLDVAESLFSKEPHWLAQVFALKGENFFALGLLKRANASYSEALRLNPGNRIAAGGLHRLKNGGAKP